MTSEGSVARMSLLAADLNGLAVSPILPRREMGAYEALWLEPRASFKKIAERFAADPQALPSDFVQPERVDDCATKALTLLAKAGVRKFGIRIHHAGDYPQKLRDARHPVELLYYRGTWEIAETRSVAVVGTRKPSEEGTARARKLARELVKHGFAVVSGLAAGIDTVAHETALAEGGMTIAVVGAALGSVYPKENFDLQERIAAEQLLVSQVPILIYDLQDWRWNRNFFPERNVTMSALTEGTIIVEAGETSGTLTQARAALHQGRKLFILNSCFERGLSWPERFVRKGAVRVRDPEDIWEHLG